MGNVNNLQADLEKKFQEVKDDALRAFAMYLYATKGSQFVMDLMDSFNRIPTRGLRGVPETTPQECAEALQAFMTRPEVTPRKTLGAYVVERRAIFSQGSVFPSEWAAIAQFETYEEALQFKNNAILKGNAMRIVCEIEEKIDDHD